MSGRTLFLGLVLALAANAPALAQGGEPPAKQPGEKGFQGGQVAFKREQGSAAELEAQVKAFMKALAERFHMKGEGAKPEGQEGKEPKEGLTPPPPKKDAEPEDEDEGKEPKEGAKEEETKDPLLATLRSWRPTKEVLEDVLTREGLEVMGRQIFGSAGKLFSGAHVKAICKRLGIRPDYQEVQVFQGSTEGLIAMDLESAEAREFAAGLKRTARLLKPRLQWFVVVLNRPKEQKEKDKAQRPKLDPADARLQLWVYSQGHYRLLGRIWRLDK
ncbi:MAG: hypothetical protein AB7N76_23270 [Planctomycetota bacterium]